MTRRFSLVAVLLTAQALVSGQAPAPSREQPYSSSTTAVLVDVVVRDKGGRPVMDLAPADFEVYEDGVRQDIASFTLVSRGAGIGIDVKLRSPETATTMVAPTGVAETADTAPPAVMALVFDALSPEALNLCQRAALEHVGMSGGMDERVAVFATEPTVRLLQRYTSEPGLIRAAVRNLAPTGTEARQARADRIDQLRPVRADLDTEATRATTATTTSQSAGPEAASAIGQLEMQRRIVEGEIRMQQAFDTMDRDHRGYGTTAALLAVFESMAYMPGRKSVMFFSEGLPVSPLLQARLQTVIEAANRSNITVYAIDATGLRVLSSTTETKREVDALGQDRLRDAGFSFDYTDGPLTQTLERTEDLMRYDSHAGLSRLADDTGGFLVRDTNNLGAAFTRVEEDMRQHYLLTYTPKNDVLDGKFRTIGVKVTRPDTVVFARKGYRAVRSPIGTNAGLSYETPALAMLDAPALPNAFPSQAHAFVFPEAKHPGLTPIVVRVTSDALQFQVDEKRSTYSAQAAIVARVRDASGQVVQKLSQQYVLSGDARDLAAAKKGEILFYREPELEPGAYRVESVVYDVIAEKGSARVSTVVVPDRSRTPTLRMSSLVLVSRTEKTPGRTAEADAAAAPFYYGDTLLYPNVGEPLRQGDDLSFYFVVYPPAGRCDCSAQITLLRNGQRIGEATRGLAPGDSDRLQHVGTLPIGKLPGGTYELRVTVSDRGQQQTREAFFTVD